MYIYQLIAHFTGWEVGTDDMELPLFDLVTVANATKNFSSANVIGEGGFGPVYKVQ